MQRAVVLGIAFRQVDGDLNSHTSLTASRRSATQLIADSFYSARAKAAPAKTAASERALLPMMLMPVKSHCPRSTSAKLS